MSRTLAQGGAVFNMRFLPCGQCSDGRSPFDKSIYHSNVSRLIEAPSTQGFKSFFPEFGHSRVHLESCFVAEEEKGVALQGTDKLIKHRENITKFRSLLCDKMMELEKIKSDVEILR